MKSITSFFETAIQAEASDIHLVADEKPVMRVFGQLVDLAEKPLPVKELETAIMGLLSAEQKEQYKENLELDASIEVDGVRFRINVHQQQRVIGLSARLIPTEIPSPEQLRFEPILAELTKLKDGLVLIVGPTGSGKSTTIASMIEQVNQTRKSHIITIEDPVEFIFEDKESLIEQREVGIDTKSFDAALKHVLRQDPNVIFVGEMRDPETIATALTAAETGHLVFSTLHTSSAAEAIERIVDVFDGAKQKQILIQLGAVLRAVVAQQLVRTVDGKLVAAREILINTHAVASLIRENNIAQLKSMIQTGKKDGMITMEQTLKDLAKADIIDKEIVG